MEDNVKLVPFLGDSSNLIHCFCYLSYNSNILDNSSNFEKIKENKNENASIIKYKLKQDEKPKLLNIIKSPYNSKVEIDCNIIPITLFPENQIIYESNKANNIQELIPKEKSVIFSKIYQKESNIDIFYYYSYIFYDKISCSEDKELYAPKAFTIISTYPYFNFFYNLCLWINEYFKRQIDIPLEIIIINILYYLPAPIKSKMIIKFNDLFNYTDPKNEINENKLCPVYILNKLNGYPIIDFNAIDLVEYLSPDLFIQIYIFIILEIDMIFFSSDIELLSMAMQLFYLVNFPFLNTNYFEELLIVPSESIKKIHKIKIVRKNVTKIIGVNVEYNDNIDSFGFTGNHYIVDLDNKRFILKNENLNDGSLTLNKLQKIIIERLQFYPKNNKNASQLTNQSRFIVDRLYKFKEKIHIMIENSLKNKAQKILNSNVDKINFFSINQISEEQNNLFYICFDFLTDAFASIYKLHIFDFSNSSFEIQFDSRSNTNTYLSIESNLKSLITLFITTKKYFYFFDNYLKNKYIYESMSISLRLTEEVIINKLNFYTDYMISKLQNLFKELYLIHNEPDYSMSMDSFRRYLINSYKPNIDEKDNKNNKNTLPFIAMQDIYKQNSNIYQKNASDKLYYYKQVSMDENLIKYYEKYLADISNEKIISLFPSVEIIENLNKDSNGELKNYEQILITNEIKNMLIKILPNEGKDYICMSYILLSGILFSEGFNINFKLVMACLAYLKYYKLKFLNYLLEMNLILVCNKEDANFNLINNLMKLLQSFIMDNKIMLDREFIYNWKIAKEKINSKFQKKEAENNLVNDESNTKKSKKYDFKLLEDNTKIDNISKASKTLINYSELNVNYNGNMVLDVEEKDYLTCSDNLNIAGKITIKYLCDNNYFTSELFSPYKIFLEINKLHLIYDETFSLVNIKKKNIIEILINTVFYLQNYKKFEEFVVTNSFRDTLNKLV